MSTEQSNKGGRPKKLGLNYYPLYASLFNSKKMRDAEDILDPTGEDPRKRLLMDKFVTRFFSEIFSRGYCMPWNDEEETAMCAQIGNGVNHLFLKLYLHAMLSSGILSLEMYEKFNILTSRGIQQKWMEISILIRRHKPAIQEEYYISSVKNEFLHDGTRLYSRRNSGNLKKKPTNTAKSTVISAKKGIGTQLIPEETQVDSRRNQGLPEKKEGVSYSSSSINNIVSSNGTIIEEERKNVPEEMPVTSGINAINGNLSPEETNILPNIPEFLHEETPVYSRSNYPEIPSATTNPTEYDLDVCMYNYLYNKQYSMTLRQHMINLGTQNWPIEHIMDFCEAFNRKLRGQVVYRFLFHGKGGWCEHFKNWIPKAAPNYKDIDPNILYTDKENENGNKRKNTGAHVAIDGTSTPARVGNVKTDPLKQLLNIQRSGRGEEPTT